MIIIFVPSKGTSANCAYIIGTVSTGTLAWHKNDDHYFRQTKVMASPKESHFQDNYYHPPWHAFLQILLDAIETSALAFRIAQMYGLVSFSKLFTSILLWQASASKWNLIQLFILGGSFWFCSCSASKSSTWFLINQTCKTEIFISMTNNSVLC